MSDHLTKPLSELLADIISDGIVDSNEVSQIRERIFADGKIDREEADFLFDINDATEGNEPSWKDLFIEAISQYLLDDPNSPGEIDEAEADWLIGKIEKDDQYDDTEKALLAHLKKEAKSIHEKLQFKIDLHNI